MKPPTQSPRRGPHAIAASARAPAIRRVLWTVLALNTFVAVIKLVMGIRTGSLTVLGAALESALDMLNNLLGMLLVTVATRAPDEDHPYGHAKFETLGALAIVGFLSISCFELLRVGVMALLRGAPRQHGTISDAMVLALTVVANGIVLWFERRRGRELTSAFLIADASHTRSDMLVTILALASLWLANSGHAWLDGALAICVALIIAWSGYRILRQSIPVLVDERAVDAAELADVVSRVPDVRGVRAVRSRSTAAGELFAEVTIAVGGTTSVERAHALADAVEAAISSAFGDAEVTVHIEPA